MTNFRFSVEDVSSSAGDDEQDTDQYYDVDNNITGGHLLSPIHVAPNSTAADYDTSMGNVFRESSVSPPAPEPVPTSTRSINPEMVIPEEAELSYDEEDDDAEAEEEEQEDEDNHHNHHNNINNNINNENNDNLHNINNNNNKVKSAQELEEEIAIVNEKLEKLKHDNEQQWRELSAAEKESSLMEEYDEKIMFYDTEYHRLLNEMNKEESLISAYKEEIQEYLNGKPINIDLTNMVDVNNSHHNHNGSGSGSENGYAAASAHHHQSPFGGGGGGSGSHNGSGAGHNKRSSIVIFENICSADSDENNFKMEQKLQELDGHILKMKTEIDWLCASKIELVKNTALEVNELRSMIKILQTNLDEYQLKSGGSASASASSSASSSLSSSSATSEASTLVTHTKTPYP